MSKSKIFKICGRCNGTGKTLTTKGEGEQIEVIEIGCPTCEGKGDVEWGYIKGSSNE